MKRVQIRTRRCARRIRDDPGVGALQLGQEGLGRRRRGEPDHGRLTVLRPAEELGKLAGIHISACSLVRLPIAMRRSVRGHTLPWKTYSPTFTTGC